MSDKTIYSYSFSVDGNYGGKFDSVEEALADARGSLAKWPEPTDENLANHSVYIGECEPLNELDIVSATSVIEDMQQRAYEECGEVTEDWMDTVTEGQRTELENLIEGWVKKHFPVEFWRVDDIHRYTLDGKDHGLV